MKESQIESSILRYLNSIPGFFAWRFHDQAAFVDGKYRKNPFEIRGVSDLCLITDADETFWIEIKTPIGKQSKHQLLFQRKLESLGHFYLLFRSLAECKQFFDSRAK